MLNLIDVQNAALTEKLNNEQIRHETPFVFFGGGGWPRSSLWIRSCIRVDKPASYFWMKFSYAIATQYQAIVVKAVYDQKQYLQSIVAVDISGISKNNLSPIFCSSKNNFTKCIFTQTKLKIFTGLGWRSRDVKKSFMSKFSKKSKKWKKCNKSVVWSIPNTYMQKFASKKLLLMT